MDHLVPFPVGPNQHDDARRLRKADAPPPQNNEAHEKESTSSCIVTVIPRSYGRYPPDADLFAAGLTSRWAAGRKSRHELKEASRRSGARTGGED